MPAEPQDQVVHPMRTIARMKEAHPGTVDVRVQGPTTHDLRTSP